MWKPGNVASVEDDCKIAELALVEGRRMLDHQVSALEGMRSRAIALLAGVTAASAFLGGAVLDRDPVPAAWSLSIPGVAYLVAVLACYWIVRSKKWISSLNVFMIRDHYLGQRSLMETYRLLAEDMQEIYDEQEKKLKGCGIALYAEMGATLLALGSWIWVVGRDW
jgi:hypothetical protein